MKVAVIEQENKKDILIVDLSTNKFKLSTYKELNEMKSRGKIENTDNIEVYDTLCDKLPCIQDDVYMYSYKNSYEDYKDDPQELMLEIKLRSDMKMGKRCVVCRYIGTGAYVNYMDYLPKIGDSYVLPEANMYPSNKEYFDIDIDVAMLCRDKKCCEPILRSRIGTVKVTGLNSINEEYAERMTLLFNKCIFVECSIGTIFIKNDECTLKHERNAYGHFAFDCDIELVKVHNFCYFLLEIAKSKINKVDADVVKDAWLYENFKNCEINCIDINDKSKRQLLRKTCNSIKLDEPNTDNVQKLKVKNLMLTNVKENVSIEYGELEQLYITSEKSNITIGSAVNKLRISGNKIRVGLDINAKINNAILKGDIKIETELGNNKTSERELKIKKILRVRSCDRSDVQRLKEENKLVITTDQIQSTLRRYEALSDEEDKYDITLYLIKGL